MPTVDRILKGHGGEAVFEALCEWDVEHVFICPGTTEAPFLDASLTYAQPQLILTTHEAVAVSMADGYSRATGRPSVAYLHTNVGLTNGLAHLYTATIAGSPVVVLNGLKSALTQSRQGFTSASHPREFVHQYTRWDWVTMTPDSVAKDINRALHFAMTLSGPTYVGLGQDLLEYEGEFPIPVRTYTGRIGGPATRPSSDLVERAARLLWGAERAVVVSGRRIRGEGLASLDRLLRASGAVVLDEDRRTFETGSISTEHPSYAGSYSLSHPAVRHADVILLAGAPTMVEFESTDAPLVPPSTSIIHLYDNPAEIGKRFVPAVGILGDASAALEDLASAVEAMGPRPNESSAFTSKRVAEYRASDQARRRRAASLEELSAIQVPALAERISRAVSKDTTVVVDAVTSEQELFSAIPRTDWCSYFSTASGSLGWGMGAALGIKLGLPDREVIGIVGDGVFQFGIPALWTARRYDVDVTFVVINNESYAAVRKGLERYGGLAAQRRSYPCSYLGGVDIAHVAQGFDIPARRTSSLDEFDEALAKARLVRGPSLIEVLTDSEELP